MKFKEHLEENRTFPKGKKSKKHLDDIVKKINKITKNNSNKFKVIDKTPKGFGPNENVDEAKLSIDFQSGEDFDKVTNAIDTKYKNKVKMKKDGGILIITGQTSIIKDIKKIVKNIPKAVIKEDVPTSNISKGNIDITPHFDPKKKKKKRGLFAGHDIFEVDSDMFAKVKREKITFERMKKHFSIEDGIGAEIHKFNRTHPYNGIVLQDSSTGVMMFFKRKREVPTKE